MTFSKSVLKVLSALTLSFFAGTSAFSQVASDGSVNAIGPHARLFIVKKSVNPENTMAVYTKMNSDCSLMMDKAQPGFAVFDFYWLMNGSNYKVVNSIINKEIHSRMTAQKIAVGGTSFAVAVNDLKQVRTDIPANKLQLDVFTFKTANGCIAQAFMTLGPSNNNVRIRLNEIYTDATASILTRSVKIKSVTLKGTDAKTGVVVSQTYRGN